MNAGLQATENQRKAQDAMAVSSKPRRVICEETCRVIGERLGSALRAVILTGSLAREEATTLEKDGGWQFLSDAEFLILFHERFRLPSAADMLSAGKQVEAALAERNVQCHISLSACHVDYLVDLRPHIFAYELRECGDVVVGDRSVLQSIRGFSVADIPLEDGWRLLSNRMVEHVEEFAAWERLSPGVRGTLFYSTVKLCLDAATSLLLFAGCYEPTYRRRAERLKELSLDQTEIQRLSLPFSLQEFAELVSFCTRLKLSPERESWNEAPWAFWETGVGHAARLWDWELARMARVSTPSSSEEMMARWMKSQPLIRNLHGWSCVLRRSPWRESLVSWPRWAWQALQGSPRNQVYAAARALFGWLPAIRKQESEGSSVGSELASGGSHLPLALGGKERAGWRRLAREIGWNYHHFLEDTRA